jgi:hypothetical protein
MPTALRTDGWHGRRGDKGRDSDFTGRSFATTFSLFLSASSFVESVKCDNRADFFSNANSNKKGRINSSQKQASGPAMMAGWSIWGTPPV